MNLKEVIWARHTWNLNEINICLEAPEGYLFSSVARDKAREIIDVVLSAYASDPIWLPLMDGIRKRMTERIQTTLGRPDADYLVALLEGEVVGASGVAKHHWTDQNLLTGICVLPEHQRKGIGTHLLGLSLFRLREMGLHEVKVYTESGSLADGKIYPLFGSHRAEGVRYPGVEKEAPADKKN